MWLDSLELSDNTPDCHIGLFANSNCPVDRMKNTEGGS